MTATEFRSEFFPGADQQQGGPSFTMASLAGKPVPPREWHVPGLIPSNTVTLLYGDGGVGKSIIAMQLWIATRTDTLWLGREVRQGPALYWSAEDERDELHRRIVEIASAEGIPLEVGSQLSIRSLAGEDALLAVPDRKTGGLAPTPLFDELDQQIGDEQHVLVALDTLADLHSGQEIERVQSRQFIGLLRGLAIRHRCAMLLLAHPSLTGMSSGTGTSGSTAWSNSGRSRLYMTSADGEIPDPARRTLTHKKTNYGPLSAPIELTWRDGRFVANEATTGLDRMAAGAKAERVFLALLAAFADEGRRVGSTPSCIYAPALFAKDSRAEGVTKRGFETAMGALFIKKAIRVVVHGPASKQREHLVAAPA